MSRTDRLLLTLIIAAGVAFLVFIGWSFAGNSHTTAPATPTHDSLTATYTYDGDIIRIYSVTDSDTGIEYLVSDHGGITPRLESTND